MKKLIATFCLAIGLVSASFAATPSASPIPEAPNVSSVQEKKSETPDVIIVVTDDKGVIIDIIVIKFRR